MRMGGWLNSLGECLWKQCCQYYLLVCRPSYINSLKIMNGHWHDVKVRIEKPVIDLHANSHNLDFDECFSVKALKSLPPLQCNSSMLRRSYQFVTNSRNPT